MGERFTQISIDQPIGFFFESLYRTGIYWNFIGWAQLVAALLLMTQRFATLGAVFFFFIVSNIWAITVALHFSGTWIITSLMLLAVIILLAWDYHKLKFIFYPDHFIAVSRPVHLPASKVWAIAGAVLFCWSIAGCLLLELPAFSASYYKITWLVFIPIIIISAFYLDKKWLARQ